MSLRPLALLPIFTLSSAAIAQCGERWLPTTAPRVNHIIECVADCPDGSIVVGGTFSDAGGQPAIRIARWDGVSWSTFGSGMTGSAAAVYAVARLPNGDIVAGGRFSDAGGVAAANLARWNGQTWAPMWTSILNDGVNTPVIFSLLTLSNGDLIAGGEFRQINGVNMLRIARWNGATWSAMGAGLGNTGSSFTPVYSLVEMNNGDIVVGGQFITSGALTVNGIARWNGTSWSTMGVGMNNGATQLRLVSALLPLPDGSLIAAGRFATAGTAFSRSVARWDGAQWLAMGQGLGAIEQHRADALTRLPDGTILAAGTFFTSGSTQIRGLGAWNGTEWVEYAGGVSRTDSTVPNLYVLHTYRAQELLVSGSFTYAGTTPSTFLARRRLADGPWLAAQSSSTAVACGGNTTLGVTPASEYTGLAYRWQRNDSGQWLDLADGPLLLGALHAAALSGTGTPALSLAQFQAPTLTLRCLVTDSCAAASMQPITLTTACCSTADYNNDGDSGTDQDIEAFFACLAGNCCPACWHLGADFNADGDSGTDADIEAFFRVLSGGSC